MALLHGMVQFCRQQQQQQQEWQYKLIVAHFNHHQRGIESDLDCQLVIETCRDYDIPCHVYHWKNKKDNHNNNNSNMNSQEDDNDDNTSNNNNNNNSNITITAHQKFSQDTARQWRRDTLTRLVQEQQQLLQLAPTSSLVSPPPTITTTTTTTVVSPHPLLREEEEKEVSRIDHHRHGIILTAHHKDDSYESLLLKLLRGVHITNLYQAIAPSTILLEQKEEEEQDNYQQESATTATATTSKKKTSTATIQLLRPFLSLSKQDLVSFLQQLQEDNQIPGAMWREDASNSSPKYLRNRVRNELVPLLEDLLLSSHDDNDYDDDNKEEDKDNKDEDNVVVESDQEPVSQSGDYNENDAPVLALSSAIEGVSLLPLPHTLRAVGGGGGGRVLLERRLETLMEQSRQVQEDLEPRVQAYLQRAQLEDGKYFQILLPHNENICTNTSASSSSLSSSNPSSLVQTQALYQWISNRRPLLPPTVNDDSSSPESSLPSSTSSPQITTGRPFSGPNVSYEQLQRVIRQLEKYPNNRQWTLEIGSYWSVVRMGNVLSVVHRQPTTSSQGVNRPSQDNPSERQSFNTHRASSIDPTTVLADDERAIVAVPFRVESSQNSDFLPEGQLAKGATCVVVAIPTFHIPNHGIVLDRENISGPSTATPPHDISHLSFVASTVGTWTAASCTTTNAGAVSAPPPALTFVPSWRRGRTPIKLKQFLRGQDIPLYQRDATPIILLVPSSSTTTATTSNNSELVQEDEVDTPTNKGAGVKGSYDDHCSMVESPLTPIVVAVCVNDKWMIHADYDPTASSCSASPPATRDTFRPGNHQLDSHDSTTTVDSILVKLEIPTFPIN
jgi:tRNA(Ile)-lysidine synthase TilS/MesJ